MVDDHVGAPDESAKQLTKLEAWYQLDPRTRIGAVRLVKDAIQPIGLGYIRAEILAGPLAIYPNFLERCYKGWTSAVTGIIATAVGHGAFPPLPVPVSDPELPTYIHAIIDVGIMVGIWEQIPREEKFNVLTGIEVKALPGPALMLPAP